jgi:hypothetical protein
MNLLSLIPGRIWLEIAGAAILLGAFGWYTAHERGIGKAHEVAVLAAQAAAQTKAAQAQADAAEHSHDSELTALAAYRDAHPDSAVQLCNAATSVPAAHSAGSGNSTAGTTAGNVQSVPAGDSGVRPGAGPDIGGLLDLLAGRADEVSAQLRVYQKVLP